MSNDLSLTPGFSLVMADLENENRLNGFSRADKPLKRLVCQDACATRLKPGVNETLPGFLFLRVPMK
jgi:hypothetical protein